MFDEIMNRFIQIMTNINNDKENSINEINELINILRDKSKKYINGILKINIYLFLSTSFLKWFKDYYFDKKNIDGDMGWLFFSYSLVLNNKKECYTNENEDIKYIKNFVNELYDFFDISRMIQSFKIIFENDNFNIDDIKNNNIDIISLINNRGNIFSKSLINHKIANIHGWHFYNFQLIDYILFLSENLPKKVLNTIGYNLIIIPELYSYSIKIMEFINKNNNPMNILKLSFFPLDIYKDIEYNKYFEKNSCNLGNNDEYLLPLDNTILSKKPFIKIEDGLYLNPFFHKIGLALGTKLLDKYLLENNLKEYVEVKSKYCEDRTFDFIKNTFKGENCLKNVFYKKNNQMFELDILLIYEPFVLCFEAKSNNITEEQQENKEKYFKKIKNDFIKKAYDQLNNFYDELKNNDEISIYESNKKDSNIICTIKKSNCIFIPFIVTMEDFSYLSGDSKILINLSNSNKNGTIPIIINIFELEIVSEVLNKNYEFINYFLQRIVSINNNTFIEDGTDEINQLGFYLKNNNITSLEYINTDTKYLYLEQSCREDIDNYFCYRLDDKKPVLPSLNLDKFILDLIDFINKNENFNRCSKNIIIQFILCLMNEFIENIKKECKVDNFYDYIEKEKNILNANSSINLNRIISKELLSIASKNDKDCNFLLSIIIHKNNNDNGEFNKSHIYTYIKNNENICNFLSISYCINNNNFNIFSIYPQINPYEYFCSKLKNIYNDFNI